MHFSFKKISFFPSFFQVKWYSYFTLLQFFFAFTINKLLSLSFESIFFGNVRIFMEIIYNRLIYFMFYIIFFVSICGQLGVDAWIWISYFFRKNFLFPNCQIFLFQTVKISFSKLSNFPFPNCQNFLSKKNRPFNSQLSINRTINNKYVLLWACTQFSVLIIRKQFTINGLFLKLY
jgi:hypothetical protein